MFSYFKAVSDSYSNGLPEFGRKASSKQKPMSPGIKLLGEGWFNLISGFQNRT